MIAPFDVNRVREQFPILAQNIGKRPLVYLDNGATTQKPQVVIDALTRFYEHDNANIHRAVHTLGARATQAYETSRGAVKRLLNAASDSEIIFTRGTTEAVNLVAHSFVRPRLSPGDEVLVTQMEHHANLVPWHLVAEATGARVTFVPLKDDGTLSLDLLPSLLTPRTKFFAFSQVSNALGTVNPVDEMVRAARERGIPTLIDGAQAVAHLPPSAFDVQALGCDFYTFSGHKLYGPTGIGALYGKREHLTVMPPYQGGGDMIHEVFVDRSTYAAPPARFEAGTPNIAGAVGLGTAIDWYLDLDLEGAHAHEDKLLKRATDGLGALQGVRIIGQAKDKIAVLSFVLDAAHAHDAATILDRHGIAVRAGHHCAQPVMNYFGLAATLRASFSVYNTETEVDSLIAAVARVLTMFSE